MDKSADEALTNSSATENGLSIEKFFGRAYTPDEIRKVLGLSRSGFYRRLQKQPESLPRSVKIGASRYFLHEDVQTWVDEKRKTSPAS